MTKNPLRGVQSQELFDRAVRRLPGGVNSPVRAFKSVGGTPPFIREGKGSRIIDEDGNPYIDYVMSYGPLLFGHSPDFLVEAIQEAAGKGTVYGAPTRAEVEIAELVSSMVPSVEMIRFVNSGSEATGSAIRLARGATGRQKIVKCAGCFHGSVDSLLAKAGSGVANLGIPESAGVPPGLAAETLVIEFNDPSAVEEVFAQHGDDIAAFIIEPVPANMGVVMPEPGYLELVRTITEKFGTVLIFDEVISGFRLARGGAQEVFGITPDLTCFGKIIGGGVPCGAYGGSRSLMENLAPIGPVYQAGTLSGNPLAMNAGLAMLREIEKCGDALYTSLERLGKQMQVGLEAQFLVAGVACQVQRAGSIITPFFSEERITNYLQAKSCHGGLFNAFFHGILDAGINVPPSQFEGWFISTAHTDGDIDLTLEMVGAGIQQLLK